MGTGGRGGEGGGRGRHQRRVVRGGQWPEPAPAVPAVVLEVCAAIRNLLMPRFLCWPDAAAADGFKARFQADSGIPDVVGACTGPRCSSAPPPA
ncbi:uncharacterized protein C2845_PM13G20010 [Panicum miliaceum]|uniref:Uncharacterized protein n=1 Tax=Panicum miliaceum TaxID=4540 RepID=A0A3L6RG07_PANMI|nr:uncharacterized protein C2845_PM13G20010 [Panicum miliaceum]